MEEDPLELTKRRSQASINFCFVRLANDHEA